MSWESIGGASAFVWRALSTFKRCGAIVLVLPLVEVSGCSVLIDANRVQCNTDADCRPPGSSTAQASCVSSVCEANPKWACLKDPAPKPGGAGPFKVTMHFADLINKGPISGVKADLCRKVDVSCGDPATTVTSDATGSISLDSVEAGFSGYVSLQSSAIVPTLYFFNPSIDRNQDIPSLSLSNSTARAGLLAQLGADTTRADVLLNASDCQGKPASGIGYELAPPVSGAIAYYLSSGLPTHNSTATDATGYGGFVNLPSGTITITATELASKTRIATLTLVVREGSATWSRVIPDGT